MRLVSSRLHRCYSRTNTNNSTHQHSSRRPSSSSRRGTGVGKEQLLCVLHVAASVALVDHTNWALHFLISPSASPIASPIRTASIAALLLVHAVDFLSALDAHRLFYRRWFLLVKQQEEQQRRDEQLQEMSSSSPPRWLSTVSPKGAPTFSMVTSATTTTAAATPTTGAAAAAATTTRSANHNNSNGNGTDRDPDQRGKTSSSSRSSLRSFLRSFVSSPGVHDMAVAGVFLIATSVLLLSAGHYHRYQAQHRLVEPPPSPAQERARVVQVRCTLFVALLTVVGSVMNIILCLPYPSLSFANTPTQQGATHPTTSTMTSTLSSSSSPSFSLLCRLHTSISAAFALCGAVKLMGLQILVYTMPDPHRDMVRFVSSASKAVDAIAAVCAIINLVRVTLLASATSARAAQEAKRLRLSMANINRGDPGATRAGAGAWWGRLFHNHPQHRRNAARHHADDDYLGDESGFLQDLPMLIGDTHGYGPSSRGRA